MKKNIQKPSAVSQFTPEELESILESWNSFRSSSGQKAPRENGPSDPNAPNRSDRALELSDLRMLYRAVEKEQILSGYNFPTKASSDNRWHIYVKDNTAKSGRRQIHARSLEELKEKVYMYEIGTTLGIARKTFRDCFAIVQQEKIRYIKDPEKLLSVKNTVDRAQSDYKRFFEGSAFEQKYVDEITELDIDNICAANLERLDLHKKAFLAMRGIMKSVFDLAFQQRWIDDNPYLRNNFKRYRDMLVKSVPVSERMHSQEEIDSIIDCLHEHQKRYPYYYGSYALELQIITGMRRGEMPPLTWKDINWNGGYISITKEQITVKGRTTRLNSKETGKNSSGNTGKKHTGDSFRIVHHTKTWKDRRFPLTSEVRDLLDRLKKAHDLADPESDFLFPADTPEGCITNNVVYLHYRRICNKLGIKVCKEVIKGTHSFRRNAISRVINNPNGGVTMACQLFGNSPEVAMAHYYTGLDLMAARDVLEA